MFFPTLLAFSKCANTLVTLICDIFLSWNFLAYYFLLFFMCVNKYINLTMWRQFKATQLILFRPISVQKKLGSKNLIIFAELNKHLVLNTATLYSMLLLWKLLIISTSYVHELIWTHWMHCTSTFIWKLCIPYLF